MSWADERRRCGLCGKLPPFREGLCYPCWGAHQRAKARWQFEAYLADIGGPGAEDEEEDP